MSIAALLASGSHVGSSRCLAAALDLGIVVEQWGDDVVGGDPSQHRANLVAAMSDSGLSVTGVSVDLAAAAELVDLAGPVVAWPTFN